jgi:hypothetical protein
LEAKVRFYHASPKKFRHGDILTGGHGGGYWSTQKVDFEGGGDRVCMTSEPEVHYTVREEALKGNWNVYEVEPLEKVYTCNTNGEFQTRAARVLRQVGSARGLDKGGIGSRVHKKPYKGVIPDKWDILKPWRYEGQKKMSDVSVDRVYRKWASRLGLVESDFVEGKPVIAYHGTTRLFSKFDMGYARESLVNKYYGAGFFFSSSESVAWMYAEGNRNVGFDEGIVEDLKKKNRRAGELMEALVREGVDAWEGFLEKHGVESLVDLEGYIKVDPNDVADLAGYVLGSKVVPIGMRDEVEQVFDVLHGGGSRGTPDWIFNVIERLGLSRMRYEPKVYKVELRATNVLVTGDRGKAKKARQNGFDGLVYTGSDLVRGVPELVVYNPSQIRILDIKT